MSNIKAKNFDLISLILVISLIFIGLINIYSVSYSDSSSIENFFSKQLIFVIFSFSICLILILLDINFYFKYASIIYIILLFSLILVLIFGKEINGAKSWFNLIGFSLQPSKNSVLQFYYNFGTYIFNSITTRSRNSIDFFKFLFGFTHCWFTIIISKYFYFYLSFIYINNNNWNEYNVDNNRVYIFNFISVHDL